MPSFTSFDGTKIEYRTRKDGDYIDLDDPESLQKVLDNAPWDENNRMITKSMKEKEMQKQASASKRLPKRLEELKYERIPDKEPGISLFRAKHKLQCFEARLDHVKQVMNNPKSERVSLSLGRRKAFRNTHFPKLRAVLKDLKDTHSRLADLPEKVELGHILERFEILNEQYEVLDQKQGTQGKPLTSTHERGSGRHSVATEPGSGRHSLIAGPQSGTRSVKPRSRTHSPAPEPTSWQDEPGSEDDEFYQYTRRVHNEVDGQLNDTENWVQQYLKA